MVGRKRDEREVMVVGKEMEGGDGGREGDEREVMVVGKEMRRR